MRILLGAIALLGCVQATSVAAQQGPVVVELYTSQGCSSCPPADALLHDLAKQDNVIALALHVDYWDYLGWKDEFASAEYSDRQHAYARAANAATVYTPQMVIDGQAHVVGSRPVQVMELIQEHERKANGVLVSLARQGEKVRIQAVSDDEGDYVVQIVRYMPQQSVSISRGENSGRTLNYAHVVTSWDVIEQWDGNGQLSIEADAAGNQPVVVIVQETRNGPIVGAAELR